MRVLVVQSRCEIIIFSILCVYARSGAAFVTLWYREYSVGSNQNYATLSAVPSYTLAAGDSVNVCYTSGCYAEKFLVATLGTSQTGGTGEGAPNRLSVQGSRI